MQSKNEQVGKVKQVIKKFMDGKFVLILMTLVTIFAIVGVSQFELTGLGRPESVADYQVG
jgi:hypothetical protein